MSSVSMSSKRRRLVSQSTTSTMKDAISLSTYAPSVSMTISGVSQQNGNERQQAQSVLTKGQLRPYLSIADLTSLLCPPFKVKTSSYGYNGYLYDSTKTAAAGDLRNIYQPAGGQYWFEAYALPAVGLDNCPTILDVQTLISKAKDIRNIANIADPPNNPLLALDKDLQFQYLGGYQRHQFVNSGNTTVFMEIWELHPRHPMIAYNTASGPVKPNTIGTDVLADMVTNQPLGNTLAPLYTTTSYDSVNDMSVRITNNMDRINMKYKVSKPVRVTIQPGGTFVYTIKLEAFKMTNSEWATLIGPPGSNPNLNGAQWMPGFTKAICARIWGEMSHSEASEAHLYSAVNSGPVNLMHTQTDYHHCRAMPFQPTKNVIIDYRLDQSNTAVEHMDELEQENEAFDD